MKHHRENIYFPSKLFHFALISDQHYRLIAHFDSGIQDLKSNTSCRPCNEHFHDKPADNSDLFSIPSEYQLSFLSVAGLK